MFVKEAPWEKRNLGVEACEYYVNTKDKSSDVFPYIKEKEYSVLHIASGNTDVLMEAQSKGFTFIEANIQLEKKLSDENCHLPCMYKRFEESISYKYADEKEITDILNIIDSGTMFQTDKISRDPFFGPRISGKRYALWTGDVIKNGAKIVVVKYKDKMIGFDVLVDRGNGIAEAFLGGVVPEYENRGLGFAQIYAIQKLAIKENYNKMITGVSSNNIPILKLHEMLGFLVSGMSYTLIKHGMK